MLSACQRTSPDCSATQFTSPAPDNSRDILAARPVLNSYSPATRRILSLDARRFYGAVCRRVVLVLACDPRLALV
jgi:hypothetical protein